MVSSQINALRWGRVSQDGTYKTPEKIASIKVSYGAESVGSGSLAQNDAGTRGENWHKSDTADSANVHGLEMENPGALAGASGGDQSKNNVPEYYQTNLSPTMALCLAIVKCDPEDAALIMEKALSDLGVMGPPLPALWSVMAEACTWAKFATRGELKAYCLASFEAMGPRDQAAFLAHVQRGAA